MYSSRSIVVLGGKDWNGEGGAEIEKSSARGQRDHHNKGEKR